MEESICMNICFLNDNHKCQGWSRYKGILGLIFTQSAESFIQSVAIIQVRRSVDKFVYTPPKKPQNTPYMCLSLAAVA